MADNLGAAPALAEACSAAMRRAEWTTLDRISSRLIAAVTFPDASSHRIACRLAMCMSLGRRRTLTSRLRDIAVAWWIERRLTREAALELYFNIVEWTDGVRGIDAAARHYCGKAPCSLDAFESVVLASLLPARDGCRCVPSSALVQRRQTNLLCGLHAAGVASAEEVRAAEEKAHLLAAALHDGTELAAAIKMTVASEVLRDTAQPLRAS